MLTRTVRAPFAGVFLNDPIDIGLDTPPFVQHSNTFSMTGVHNGAYLKMDGQFSYEEMIKAMLAMPAAAQLCVTNQTGGKFDVIHPDGVYTMLDRHVQLRCSSPPLPLESPAWYFKVRRRARSTLHIHRATHCCRMLSLQGVLLRCPILPRRLAIT